MSYFLSFLCPGDGKRAGLEWPIPPHPSQTCQAQIEATTLLASYIQSAELLLLRSQQKTETIQNQGPHPMTHTPWNTPASEKHDCSSHTMEHPSLCETPSKTKDHILQLHIHTPWEHPSLLLSSEYLANIAVRLNSK